MTETAYDIIRKALEFAYEQGVVSDAEIDLAYDSLPEVELV